MGQDAGLNLGALVVTISEEEALHFTVVLKF